MATPSSLRFTDTQGQYLAFIHAYALVNRRPPAEADMQRLFAVTPPSVHSMIQELQPRGLITRVPPQPRSIAVVGTGGRRTPPPATDQNHCGKH